MWLTSDGFDLDPPEPKRTRSAGCSLAKAMRRATRSTSAPLSPRVRAAEYAASAHVA